MNENNIIDNCRICGSKLINKGSPYSPSISCCGMSSDIQLCEALERKGLRFHPDYEFDIKSGYPEKSYDILIEVLKEDLYNDFNNSVLGQISKMIEEATGGATKDCSLLEAVSILISQRDNARNEAVPEMPYYQSFPEQQPKKYDMEQITEMIRRFNAVAPSVKEVLSVIKVSDYQKII